MPSDARDDASEQALAALLAQASAAEATALNALAAAHDGVVVAESASTAAQRTLVDARAQLAEANAYANGSEARGHFTAEVSAWVRGSFEALERAGDAVLDARRAFRRANAAVAECVTRLANSRERRERIEREIEARRARVRREAESRAEEAAHDEGAFRARSRERS